GCSREEAMGLLMSSENPGLSAHIFDQADPERQARRKLALSSATWVQDAFAKAPAMLPPGVRSLGEGPPPPTLEIVSAATLADKPVPVREWVVPGLVPCRTVTDVAADGGTGKSLLMLQLAMAVATGRQWLDMD